VSDLYKLIPFGMILLGLSLLILLSGCSTARFTDPNVLGTPPGLEDPNALGN